MNRALIFYEGIITTPSTKTSLKAVQHRFEETLQSQEWQSHSRWLCRLNFVFLSRVQQSLQEAQGTGSIGFGRWWNFMDKLKEKSPVSWSLERRKRNEQVKPGISHSDSYVTFHPQLLYRPQWCLEHLQEDPLYEWAQLALIRMKGLSQIILKRKYCHMRLQQGTSTLVPLLES